MRKTPVANHFDCFFMHVMANSFFRSDISFFQKEDACQTKKKNKNVAICPCLENRYY